MQIKSWRMRVCTAVIGVGAAVPQLAAAHEGDCEDDLASDTSELRAAAYQKLAWQSPRSKGVKQPIPVQILGFNDFHGQLSAGRKVSNRPVGGAAVLASYLKSQQAAFTGSTFIVHAGDHVGASPAASALLQDEPSITFLNMLANERCEREREQREERDGGNLGCNLVGTLGNHEFDEGVSELKRLLDGGIHEKGLGSSRVDLQACKLEYSIVSPK